MRPTHETLMHHDTSSILTAHRDVPSSAATLAGDPLPAWQAPLRRWLARVRHGRLTLTWPDGRRLEVTGPMPGPRAELRLHRWRPVLRLLMEGDLGLAFSYRDDDWSSPDLTALLMFGVANEAALGGVTATRGPARWLSRGRHRANANTRRGSHHNIAAHYDLGNRFYAKWLDDSMLYSSAMYGGDEIAAGDASCGGETPTPADASLEAAQARRLDRIVELLDLRAGQRVLEIGCGWGTLAATLARRCGVEVVGVTLSTEQLAFAQQRAAEWGVAARGDRRRPA